VLETLAPYALPVCFILAVVATYGRLAADKEWTAIQMAGFHPLKMLLPGVVVALVLGAGNYWMVSYELPLAKKRQRLLMMAAATSSLSNLQPGRTTLQFKYFFLNAKLRDPKDQNILYDVQIRKPDDEGEGMLDIFAKKAYIRTEGDMFLVDIYDFVSVGEGAIRAENTHVGFGERIDKLIGTQRKFETRARYMTNREIQAELDKGVENEDRRTSMRFDLQYRRSMGAIYLVFLGLGAPTGLIMRRGTQLGALAVAVGYGLLYYIFAVRLGRELGRSGAVEPWVGAWAVPAIGSLVAVVLLWKALKR